MINTSTSFPVDVAVLLKPVTTLSADMQTIAEKPYNQMRTLGVAANSNCQTTFTGFVNNGKLLGVTEDRYPVDNQYSHSKSSIMPILTHPLARGLWHGHPYQVQGSSNLLRQVLPTGTPDWIVGTCGARRRNGLTMCMACYTARLESCS